MVATALGFVIVAVVVAALIHSAKPRAIVLICTQWWRRSTARPNAPVPSHWLALTFDGGYPDFYTNVYPVLSEYSRFPPDVSLHAVRLLRPDPALILRVLNIKTRATSAVRGAGPLTPRPPGALSPPLSGNRSADTTRSKGYISIVSQCNRCPADYVLLE